MRVNVDRDLCEEHGQCVLIAPEVFSWDAEGRLEFREHPDSSQRGAVEDAVEFCPVQAISMSEDGD